MSSPPLNILLADDDSDDCYLFKDALSELSFNTSFDSINNGEELMNFLNNDANPIPNVLFLDLNMPRKNGLECLTEIKAKPKLKSLPVIIYSTSFQPEVVNQLFLKGATHYIRKPNQFDHLKRVIDKALNKITASPGSISTSEDFVIKPFGQ